MNFERLLSGSSILQRKSCKSAKSSAAPVDSFCNSFALRSHSTLHCNTRPPIPTKRWILFALLSGHMSKNAFGGNIPLPVESRTPDKRQKTASSIRQKQPLLPVAGLFLPVESTAFGFAICPTLNWNRYIPLSIVTGIDVFFRQFFSFFPTNRSQGHSIPFFPVAYKISPSVLLGKATFKNGSLLMSEIIPRAASLRERILHLWGFL